MKRITFEVNDLFAGKFVKYCEENNISKKSAIVTLIMKELKKNAMMEQYANTTNENSIDFINKENYERLTKINMEDEESWKMNRNLLVNKNINYYFEKDETLTSLLFFSNMSKIDELSIASGLLDHYYYIKFDNKDIDYDFEHLCGIMTFPYINFKELGEVISSWGTNFWNLYIINPALMKYVDGSLGLFITPVNFELAIADYNAIFETLTGYKLFYLWTDEKKISPIMQNKESRNIDDWFKSLTDEEFPKMHKKIVKFWFDNKEKINCHALKESYFQFTHKMEYEHPPLMLLTLKGGDFEMFDTKSGWSSGKCNKLGFDLKSFNCIYVNGKEVVFSIEMLKNFKDGSFELKMI